MKSTRRVLSLVLAMLMLFSMFTVAASAKNIEVAETGVTMTGGEVLYLKPNSNWVQSSAWFAAYFFGSGNQWVKMESCPRDSGYYKVTVPSGSWTNVIFCRMNPSATALSWDSKWDQSQDLTYDGTKSLWTVGSGQWNNATGTWSVWSETPEPTTEEPTTEEPTEEVTEEPTEEVTEEPTTLEPPVAMDVYCINSAKWDAVYAYAWNEGGDKDAEWPGSPMTKTEDTVNGFDVYKITIEGGPYASIIFNNNNNGSQTSDLALEEGKYYDVKAGEWYASLDEVPQVDPLATDRYLVGSFNGWSTVADEFKLNAEGEKTGYVTLTLEANTKYEFKVVREGTWTSCTTPITGSVEGLTFSSSNSDNATITTTEAGEYVFSFGLENSQLGVVYPVAATEEPTDAPTTEETEAPTAEETEAPTTEETEAPTAEETEAPTDEPTEEETEEPTDAPVVIPAGYYLVGTLNGADCWFVDENSADRMLVANEGNPGEYMLNYTFVEGDAIKVVYFDGTAISAWYNDGGENYNIGAAKAGDATVYFRPEGNSDWSYFYFTVIPVVVEDPTDAPTDAPTTEEPSEATGDQPTVAPEDPTEEETEEPTTEPIETMTIYFQNNWLWSDVKLYYWGSTVAENPEWNGISMDFYDNDGNYDVYVLEVPTDVTGIIISGIKDDGTGSLDKTPDITEGWYDGICYYMMWDNGNAVGSANITEIFPEEEPTEEPTVENATAVEGLTAETSRTQIHLTWEAAAGAVKYWVFVDGVAYDSTEGTEMVISGRQTDTYYEIYVLGVFEDGTMMSFADAEILPVQTMDYYFEDSFTAGATSITLSWYSDLGCTKTWIYFGTSADDLRLYASSLVNSYTIDGLQSGTTYYYSLAYYIDGKYVADETVNEVTTATDDVLNVTAELGEGVINVDWNAAYDSYKYWITVDTADYSVTFSATDTELAIDLAKYPNIAGDCTITVKAACGVDGVFNSMLYYYTTDLTV